LLQFSSDLAPERQASGTLAVARLAQQLQRLTADAQAAQAESLRTELQLDPPHLGRVNVQLALQGSAVAVQLNAAGNSARRELRESLAAIRQGLVEAGLEITDITIVEQSAEPHSGDGSGQPGNTGAGTPLDRAAQSHAGPAVAGQVLWQGLLAEQLAAQSNAA
jgi:flagellar hook-length control protein FliK